MVSLRRGFTLIELLIVVAIIGILAAIAIPNFLQAQTRAKVAKTVSEMRSINLAAESYRIDNGRYPLDCNVNACNGPSNDITTYKQLTTPISYVTFIPLDVWGEDFKGCTDNGPAIQMVTPLGAVWDYGTREVFGVGAAFGPYVAGGIYYSLISIGPDACYNFNFDDVHFRGVFAEGTHPSIYDPSNGVASRGDIFGSDKGIAGGGI